MPQSRSRSWRALYPFKFHWLDTDAGRMHFLDERPPADRPVAGTLLFVHGNPTWSFHWRKLIDALRSRFRCVAVDHVGCGLSDIAPRTLRLKDRIKHLEALVDHLRLQRVALVAQDWGGAIGLGLLTQRPELADRILLFNTGAFPPPSVPWRIRACRLPLVGRIAVQGLNVFSRAALRMTMNRRRLEPAVAAGYLAPYASWKARRSVYDFVDDIPTATHQETWQLLADIESRLAMLANRPAALVWGMRDWCFTPDCLEPFIAAWPQAQVHRLDDVGHWVVEDAPEETLRLATQFLDADADALFTEKVEVAAK